MKKLLYIYIIGFYLTTAFSQKSEVDSLPNALESYILVKPGDTAVIHLTEFMLLPEIKFKSHDDIRYFKWFTKKVYKAYPYAILASQRIDSLQNRLSKIKSTRKRKKYIKKIQNYVEGEFTAQIKGMTTTEGRVLIKLIHRQTGLTAFQNIKKLRSGWKAFWYNTTANIFNLSLKQTYNPALDNEAYLIEYVLQRAFVDDKLVNQKPKIDFDFQKIAIKKRGEINIEKYRQMFAKQRKRKRKVKKKK